MASPFLVLVEGPDDREVCKQLLRRQSDLEILAIVVDADLDLKSKWAELSHKIRTLGYETCPNQPDPHGTIIVEENMPLLGVWIMPDNNITGVLEDFVAALIPEGDPLWPRAQQCVDQIPREQRPFKEASLPKARIHTWLAWQEEPGTKMGEALGKSISIRTQ